MPPDGELRAAIVQDAATAGCSCSPGWTPRPSGCTRETGEAWFWSRSREEYWHKGETSGNTMAVEELRDDCDGDALLAARAAGRPRLPHRLALVLRTRALANDLGARGETARGLVHDRAARGRGGGRCAQGRRGGGRDDGRGGRRATSALVSEAADLIYHLYVLLAAARRRHRRRSTTSCAARAR